MGAVVTLWPVAASLGDTTLLWGQQHPLGTQSIPGGPGSLLQQAQGWHLDTHSFLGASPPYECPQIRQIPQVPRGSPWVPGVPGRMAVGAGSGCC